MNRAAITSSGGVRLATYEWAPDWPTRAVVVLAHAYSEHAGRYDRLALELVSRRYAVFALDHRGHGESEGPRASCDRFDSLTDDFAILTGRARERFADLPCFALGHSMGSLVALGYALDGYRGAEDLSGLVVSGVPLRPGREIPGPLRPAVRSIIRAVARVRPDLPLIPPRLSRLCGDPEVVRAFRSDPLCYSGLVRAGFADQILKAAEAITERLEDLTCPLFVLHGELDIMADPGGAILLDERAGSKDKTLRLFDGLHHEIFNEKAAPSIFATLADWLDARVLATHPRPRGYAA